MNLLWQNGSVVLERIQSSEHKLKKKYIWAKERVVKLGGKKKNMRVPSLVEYHLLFNTYGISYLSFPYQIQKVTWELIFWAHGWILDHFLLSKPVCNSLFSERKLIFTRKERKSIIFYLLTTNQTNSKKPKNQKGWPKLKKDVRQ